MKKKDEMISKSLLFCKQFGGTISLDGATDIHEIPLEVFLYQVYNNPSQIVLKIKHPENETKNAKWYKNTIKSIVFCNKFGFLLNKAGSKLKTFSNTRIIYIYIYHIYF